MRTPIFLLTFLIFFMGHTSAFSQKVYDVELDVRENSVVINNTALELIEEEKHETAVRILESVLKDDPSFHPAYLNYYRAGKNLSEKTDRVVEVLKTGLKIFEEDDEMAYYLGNLFQKEKRYEEAIAAYTEAINYSKVNGEDFPLVWAYYFNRANCYLKTNQYKKSLPDYDYALTLSPGNYDVLTNRGYAFYKTDNSEAACEDWKNARQLGSKVTQKYLDSYCR